MQSKHKILSKAVVLRRGVERVPGERKGGESSGDRTSIQFIQCSTNNDREPHTLLAAGLEQRTRQKCLPSSSFILVERQLKRKEVKYVLLVIFQDKRFYGEKPCREGDTNVGGGDLLIKQGCQER